MRHARRLVSSDDVAGLSDSEIREVLDELEPEEHSISARRRRLHERIDFVRAAHDDATSAALLPELDAQEREISAARRVLHRRIDALRDERDRRASL